MSNVDNVKNKSQPKLNQKSKQKKTPNLGRDGAISISGGSKSHALDVNISSYIDKSTMITKDGDLVKMIKIECEDRDANLRGLIKTDLVNVIEKLCMNKKFNPGDYYFWIHTISSKDKDIELNSNIPSGSIISDYIKEKITKKLCNTSKSVVCYISILQKTQMTFNIIKSVMSFFSSGVSESNIKKELTRINFFTNEILSELKKYNASIISVNNVSGEKYTLDHLSIIHKICTFQDLLYNIESRDVASYFSNLKFMFEFGFFVAKNEKYKQYGAVLVLKNDRGVNGYHIDKIINRMQSCVLCESFSIIKGMEKNDGINSVIGQNKEMREIYELDSDNDLDYSAKKSSRVILYENSLPLLKKKIKFCYEICDELGVVVVQEDVGISTALYGSIPGSKNALARSYLCPISNIGNLIQSYTMNKKIIEKYEPNSYRFGVETVRSYPFLIGNYANKKHNVFFISNKTHYQSVMGFFINMMQNEDENMFILSSNNDFYRILLRAIGGSVLNFDLSDEESGKIDPIYISESGDYSKEERSKITQKFLSFLVKAVGTRLGVDILDEIKKISDTAVNCSDIVSFSLVESIYAESKSDEIRSAFYHWLYGNNFANIACEYTKDPIDMIHNNIDQKNVWGFNFAENIISNQNVTNLLTYSLLLKIKSLSKYRNSLVFIIGAELILKDEEILSNVLEMADNNNIKFVFLLDERNIHTEEDIMISSSMSAKFKEICGNIFYGAPENIRVSTKYIEAFELSESDLNAIDLSKKDIHKHSFSLFSDNTTKHLDLDLSYLDQTCISILTGSPIFKNICDKIETKEGFNSWLMHTLNISKDS